MKSFILEHSNGLEKDRLHEKSKKEAKKLLFLSVGMKWKNCTGSAI